MSIKVGVSQDIAKIFNDPNYVKKFGDEYGLDCEYCRKMLQDKDGFIWIVFNSGLVRFDGLRFNNFFYSPDSEIALKQGDYNNIFEDSKGRLWVTGFEGGAYCLDKSNNTYEMFSHDPNDSTSISTRHTGSVYEDEEGTIWLAGNNYVLHRYDEDSRTFKRFYFDISMDLLAYDNEFTYLGDIIQDVLNKDIFWIGSRYGLIKFNREKGTYHLFELPKDKQSGILGAYCPIPICQIDDKIWLGSLGTKGLMFFDPKKEEYSEKTLTDDVLSSIYRNKVLRIMPISPDTILVLTVHQIWLVDKNTLEYKVTSFESTNEIEYYFDLIMNDEKIWIIANNVLWELSESNLPVQKLQLSDYHNTNKQNISASMIASRKSESIFIGMLNGDGLWRFNYKEDKMKPIGFDNKSVSNQSYNVDDLCYDKDDKLWMTTSRQVAWFDEMNDKINFVTTKPSLRELLKVPIPFRLESSGDYLFIALYENGLVRMNLKTLELVPFTDNGALIIFAKKRISSIMKDDNDRIWIGTNEGVYMYDPMEEIVTKPILIGENVDNSIRINDIDFYEGTIYLGTFGYGIWKVDPKDYSVEIVKNEFNGVANLIYKVLVTDEAIWTTNQFGTTIYDIQKDNKSIDFRSSDFSGRTWFEHELLSYDDGVIMGSSHQLIKLNLDTISKFGFIPKAYIESAQTQSGNDLVTSDPFTMEMLTFRPDDKDFFIKLGAINYNFEAINQFKYRLKGYDDLWYSQRGNDRIGYTNLRPGEYLFEYYAEDQYTIGKAIPSQIKIKIEAHFYQTKVFKIIVALASAFLIGFYTRKYILSKKRKEQFNIAKEYINSSAFSGLETSQIIQEISTNLNSIFNHETFEIIENEINQEASEASSGKRQGAVIHSIPLVQNDQYIGSTLSIYSSHKPDRELKLYFDKLAEIIAAKISETKAVQEIEKKDKALQKLQQERVGIELSALRAQMNPHFLFNTLNSINWYIIKNKSAEASKYLTKFSKLMRLILDNSKAEKISLAREIETLTLYTEMEEVRFENEFDYEFRIASGIDADRYLMPPLLFQPFIENAIWHGLVHKTGKGHIYLDITKEQGGLKCVIEDDGIGREEAKKIKAKSSTQSKSSGIEITKKRILGINEEIHEPFKIIDLVNDDGVGIGTRVEIYLPILKAKD